DAKLVQQSFDKNQYSSQWNATSIGGTMAQGLFKGMYTLTASNSGKVVAVTSAAEGAGLAQYGYSAANPMQNWYALPMGTSVYQFVNRSTGKCMALATDVATAAVVQKDCANNDSQKFTLTATGSPDQYTLKSRYGKLLEVKGYTSNDGAIFTQATATAADPQRKFKLTPILAGEPHRLTFSHSSDDAACGDYFWYDIKQPNGLPVANPAETFVQLIFAGGKTSLGGADENPFIAQQNSGTQVAIDPSGYMTGGSATASGSCIASDIVYDNAKTCGGKCCVKYNGGAGLLAASSWSTTTFVCQ
ncbi:MAG TPA: RICIN domain-containing protein, partial [Polyangiaceae bacterium]|nr:RICIN domain-containing protein [Polyangiaceae bacterium]